ncbi:MAG TPA: PEP-utilizing enzyme, partial [Anaerolineae bacterium]
TPYSLGTRVRRLPITLRLRRAYAGLWREAEQFRQDFGGIEREFLSVQFDRMLDNDLGNLIRRLLNFHYRTNYYRLATACLATLAHADLVPMVEALNRSLPSSEKPVGMTDLINVKEIVATARPVLRMWKIARAALISSTVTRVICETPAPDLPARLQSFEAGRVFWNEVSAYIAEFYYLSDADEDYARPRLGQQPALVLSSLKQLVAANFAANPAASLLERHTRQASEQARANRYLSRGLLNSLLRRRSFSSQLQIVRTYIYWQEEMRVLLARANYLGHRVFVELGRRWAAQGVLDKPGDVFALSGAQLFGLLEGKSTAGDTRTSVERWNRVYAAFRNFSAPWLLGQTTPATRELPDKQTNKYAGIGCSGGRVTGIARVIDDLADAGKFTSGEILIAPFTNPGWVPLFSLAAAIVVEQGNLLSHEAVVARQVGLPAVLQLKHATRFLQDGQRVTVDGNLGTVSVLT